MTGTLTVQPTIPPANQPPEITWSSTIAWDQDLPNMGNKLHTVCSYMAMFPPSIPNYFVQRYSQLGDTVLDPFSGRGTAPLEACCLGRIGIGNDRNPLAYVLTFAKTNTPSKGRILKRLEKLEQSFKEEAWNVTAEDWRIQMIFHDRTLKQLLHLRRELDWGTSNVDAFIAAMVVGIIHGNSPGYLSLRMPNTFSMSPNYVKGYISKHKLEKPDRDAFALLRRKLERCYQDPETKGRAFFRDARRITPLKEGVVDLVVTSPPYTRVIRYGAFNWIRLWFLGEDPKDIDAKLLCTHSLGRYLAFMTEFLQEMKRVVKPGGHVVLVIGDVRDKNTGIDLNLAGEVWRQSAFPLGYELAEAIQDGFDQETKVSRIWGEVKRGRATKTDRILVLKRAAS